MGDSDSVRFSDGEYIEGMTFTQHLNQMKLSALVATTAVVCGFLFIQAPAGAQYFPSPWGQNNQGNGGGNNRGGCRGYDDGPGGPCYSGPGGNGMGCSRDCPY